MRGKKEQKKTAKKPASCKSRDVHFTAGEDFKKFSSSLGKIFHHAFDAFAVLALEHCDPKSMQCIKKKFRPMAKIRPKCGSLPHREKKSHLKEMRNRWEKQTQKKTQIFAKKSKKTHLRSTSLWNTFPWGVHTSVKQTCSCNEFGTKKTAGWAHNVYEKQFSRCKKKD